MVAAWKHAEQPETRQSMQYRRAPWMTGACKDMPHRQNEPRVAHIQMEQVWSARRANCELLISARPAGHCTWTPQRGPRSTLPSDHSKGGDAEEERSTFQDSCASWRAGGWCSWDAGHRGGLGPALWGPGPPRAASFTHHSSGPPALPRAPPPQRTSPRTKSGPRAITSQLPILSSSSRPPPLTVLLCVPRRVRERLQPLVDQTVQGVRFALHDASSEAPLPASDQVVHKAVNDVVLRSGDAAGDGAPVTLASIKIRRRATTSCNQS